MQPPHTPARNPILLLSPRALLGSLFSFEALLILYIFAGLYKADPSFAWIPFDPTGMFFVLSVAVGSIIIVTNKLYKKGFYIIFAMLCFIAWFAVTLTWSPSRLYGPDKLFLMATLELWAVVAGALIIAPDRERVKRCFTLILLLSVWVGTRALLVYLETGGGIRISIGSGTYLSLGRLCGLGALIALVAWLFGGHRHRLGNPLLLALFLGLSFVLVISGGRGPLIATVGAFLIPLFVGFRLTKKRILYTRRQLVVLMLAVAAGAALAGHVVVTERTPETIKRLEGLVTADELRGSAAARAGHYTTAAAQLWPQAPVLGHGAGSWPILNGSSDVQRHPHNLFLEVLVETGLVGFAFLLLLLGTALRPVSLDRLRDDPAALCILMLFVNTFLNAMVSGDIPDNRAMFLPLGMLTIFAMRGLAPTPAPAAADPPRAAAVRAGGGAAGASTWSSVGGGAP